MNHLLPIFFEVTTKEKKKKIWVTDTKNNEKEHVKFKPLKAILVEVVVKSHSTSRYTDRQRVLLLSLKGKGDLGVNQWL